MKRKKGVVARRIEDGLILYDPEQDEAFVLNETGALVWENAESPPQKIVSLLVSRWDAPAQEAEKDVRAFVDELVARGLLIPE